MLSMTAERVAVVVRLSNAIFPGGKLLESSWFARYWPDSQQKSSSKNPPLQHSQGSGDLPGARRKHRGNPAVQAFNNVVKGKDLIVCEFWLDFSGF
jgi:hypothetical protein